MNQRDPNPPALSRRRSLQLVFGALLLIIFPLTIRGAEIESASFLATITEPGPRANVAGNPAVSPILLPDEETFTIRGVAERERAISLYSWSIIPGTDGNTSTQKTITDFTAEQTTPGNITFRWQPRLPFQPAKIAELSAQAGRSCEILKTHCSPPNNENIGEANTNCPDGNVPENFDCTLPKKYSAFHDLVKPDAVLAPGSSERIRLEFPVGVSESDFANVKNNTKLTAPECQSGAGCEYDGIPVGWRTTLKPFSGAVAPLLTTALGAVNFEHFHVDEANGFIPHLGANSPGNSRAEDILTSGIYTPNIGHENYSGLYVFSYFNFVRALNPNVTGVAAEPYEEYGVRSFFPVKDLTVLVDGFDQYELYAVPANEYEPQKGVTRENGTLVKVLRDPSLAEVSVDLAASGLDSDEAYYFSLFEVRESGFTDLPDLLTQSITAKSVSGSDCIGDPENPANCPAVIGHLISTSNEVLINRTTLSLPPSPPKREWQIFEPEGKYTSDPIRSDRNGEIRCGAEQNEPCTFPRSQLNRLASSHFLAATYQGTTAQNSGRPSGFSIQSDDAASNLFQLQDNPNIAARRTNENLYGVVFNSWTKEILPHVRVELSGTRTSRQETVRSLQKTSRDGLFTFLEEPGKYFLKVLALSETTNIFLFPSKSYPLPATDAETCGDDGIFSNVLCGLLEINLKTNELIRNIPVDPTIRGQLQNVSGEYQIILQKNNVPVARTRTLPNGKFSFFVSPGNYVISEIQDANGRTVLSPNEPVEIPALPSGQPERSVSVTLDLTE